MAPPGCFLSSSPDGPNKGVLYVPSERGELPRNLILAGFLSKFWWLPFAVNFFVIGFPCPCHVLPL